MDGLKKAQQLRLNAAREIPVNGAYSKPRQRRISAQKGRWVFVGSSLISLLLFLFFMGAFFSPSDTESSKQALPSSETPESPIEEKQQAKVLPLLIRQTDSQVLSNELRPQKNIDSDINLSIGDHSRPVSGRERFETVPYSSGNPDAVPAKLGSQISKVVDENLSEDEISPKDRKEERSLKPEVDSGGDQSVATNNRNETAQEAAAVTPVLHAPLPTEPLPEKPVQTASLSSDEKTLSKPVEVGPEIRASVSPSKEKEGVGAVEWVRQDTRTGVPSVSDAVKQFNLAVSLHRGKETAKAVQSYRKALESDPAFTEAYNNLGLLYQELGEFDKAQEAYQKSAEINPRYEKAYNNLGILFLVRGREDEALEAFQRALTINPNNVESHINLGILYKRRRQPHQAIESYQRALSVQPLHGEAHYNMALLYEQLEDVDLAVRHYQKFVQAASTTYPGLASKVQKHIGHLQRTKNAKNR